MARVNPSPKSLPEILPVFPLTGALLLPGTILPLHIFEPRYRNLVDDALRAEGVFGMIQPVVPRQDNRPLPGAEKETPELYKIGCAGYIEQWEKLPDGRFAIKLKGLNRFRVEAELPSLRGYRRVKADYSAFPDSPVQPRWRCDREALFNALQVYCKAHGLNVQLNQLKEFSDVELVNLLGVALPFHPAEKQALLEAPSFNDRNAVLLNLLTLGAGPDASGSEVPKRTLN
ncbi:MAG: LON peptidase substrate-binding domain-containing protein [Deltaproteobacteria bacterium]|nr:LON peptidase substrate-binding domain-containing protein [Deltaproteobacteria bacterium]